MMETPSSFYLECPVCKDQTLHKLLKGKTGETEKEFTIDGVVECGKCKNTRHRTIREKSAIDVPVIVSWKEESKKSNISLLPDEVIKVDDELLIDDSRVKITSIETEDGGRKDSAKAEDVVTIWTKKHDKVRVKIALHKGTSTISKTIEVPPEEEFYVNDEIEVGKHSAVIHRIKSRNGIVKKGKVVAEDITRIYAKEIDGHFL